MGAWSNVVEVTVVQEEKIELDVSRVEIQADKATVAPGEEVVFSGTAVFTTSADSPGCVYADIYVNGKKVREGVRVGSYSTGDNAADIGFRLSFQQPGSYSVRAYVYLGPCGLR